MGFSKVLVVLTSSLIAVPAPVPVDREFPVEAVVHVGEVPRAQLADASATLGGHAPPVDAPVIDPFRAPEHRFGPGNQGIEYGTISGGDVTASAGGVVVFAGQVGGNLFVTVDHGDGLVTTVGYLDAIRIRSGQVVEKGEVIATSTTTLHFSARLNGVYIDPQLLFGGFRIVVRLVSNPG